MREVNAAVIHTASDSTSVKRNNAKIDISTMRVEINARPQCVRPVTHMWGPHPSSEGGLKGDLKGGLKGDLKRGLRRVPFRRVP